MQRVKQIMTHPLFVQHLGELEALEAERIFCRHGLQHLLDVARIAWILSLELQTPYPKELVYATALLHDIGKGIQIRENIPHHKASKKLAAKILPECGFDQQESALILDAIKHHRKPDGSPPEHLNNILYRADKLSRACYACPVGDQCNWDDTKKNLMLYY